MVSVLVIMCGLPGTGKTYIAGQIASKLRMSSSCNSISILEGDQILRQLFPATQFKRSELIATHAQMRAQTSKMLAAGQHVIYDATNITRDYRDNLCKLASNCGSHSLIVHTIANEQDILRRLCERSEDKATFSSADETVYMRMKDRWESIQRSHYIVNTSAEIKTEIARIIKKIVFLETKDRR